MIRNRKINSSWDRIVRFPHNLKAYQRALEDKGSSSRIGLWVCGWGWVAVASGDISLNCCRERYIDTPIDICRVEIVCVPHTTRGRTAYRRACTRYNLYLYLFAFGFMACFQLSAGPLRTAHMFCIIIVVNVSAPAGELIKPFISFRFWFLWLFVFFVFLFFWWVSLCWVDVCLLIKLNKK